MKPCRDDWLYLRGGKRIVDPVVLIVLGANWLKHGDRNTEFFHNYATQRKRRNTIKGLVDNLGVLHEEREAMCKLVQDFFESLHTSEVQDIDASVLNDVQKKVSVEMNRGLTAPFTPDEVRKALFSIGDLKAPGPDGLHAVFYKRFWDMLGATWCRRFYKRLTQQQFRRDGIIPPLF